MKVLYVDHETRLSGGQRDLVDLVAALRESDDLQLHAAVPDEGPLARALRDAGVIVHLVPTSARLRRASRWDLARRPWIAVGYLLGTLAATWRLVRLARRIRPDIVHTNSLKAHLLAVPAARVVRAPLVWHIRDILEASWLRSLLVRLAGRVPARVVSLSEVAAEPFRAHRAAGRGQVVHNGIHRRRADPGAVHRWRYELGVPGVAPLIGIVGQIAWWKGQDVFVDAARKIAVQHPDARFAVVGECLFPENEGDYEASIRAAAASDPRLADRLTWTGPVNPIEPVMAACDVFVHASRLPEPFGRVIVEALAQGTPVVSTTAGAGPEILTSETGVTVAPGDPDTLADAVIEVLAEPSRFPEAAALARAADFDIARTADGVLAVYEGLRRPS